MVEDPEIVADLALRSATERDPTRTSDANYERAVKELLDDPVVTRWPCRGRGCNELVDAPRSAVESMDVFNRQLERRRQPLIRTSEVLYCQRCKARLQQEADAARRAKDERLAPVVKLLIQSSQPEREHALIRQLREWKHPDVDGLVQALVARRSRSGGGGSI